MSVETTSDWVPSTCTLPTVEQPLRAREFDDLFAANLVDVEQMSPTRARFAFAGAQGILERVQDLADRESSCCSFFGFTVAPVDDSALRSDSGDVAVNLDVEVPAAHADVLAALVKQARAQSSPADQDCGSSCCATPA